VPTKGSLVGERLAGVSDSRSSGCIAVPGGVLFGGRARGDVGLRGAASVSWPDRSFCSDIFERVRKERLTASNVLRSVGNSLAMLLLRC